ncbi:hypothetical protein B0H10DRAFT_2193503 [Mycena sp. CBHHK59/15]|nr:hypothetical protein B0H10DRAFT_2193503 [Mycena sp. CBHHK59/15]
MAPAKRRVSYIIPPPTEPVPRLDLPPPTADRLGLVRPLIVRAAVQPPPDPDAATRTRHPHHRLAVAALAIDTATTLAGRPAPRASSTPAAVTASCSPGTSASPSAAAPRPHPTPAALTGWADDAIDEEAEEADERPTSDGDVLGDVTAAAARRRHPPRGDRELPLEEQWEMDVDAFRPTRLSTFRQCAQTHTDWVNDILLCNNNQTLVSASSDGTVQAWSPHASGTPDPSVLGTHADYVRCLAGCRAQGWVASGSFDRTIKLWDLARAGTRSDPLMTLHPPDAGAPKGSVYALAADPFGHAVASGGPERVVRMWDPRSGKRTGKLVGHTDNIRAILLSEDARYLLTGSADASIKLWSLATQRCLHTFTHHADSVWALASTHPALEAFYAGDRAGLVSRVDVRGGVPDVGEGECILVCRTRDDEACDGAGGECGGGGQGGKGGQGGGGGEGVNRLVLVDDTLLWAATSASTVRRWRVPPRISGSTSAGLYGAGGAAAGVNAGVYGGATRRFSYSSTRLSPGYAEAEFDGSARSLAPSVISHDGEDDGGETLYGIPYASLVRLTSPNDPFPVRTARERERDAEVATLYSAASVVSVPGLRSPGLSTGQVPTASRAPGSARAAYFARDMAADAVPLAPVPDAAGALAGERGLVRALVLNDRVHAVSVDTGGEVGVWDLVRGVCVGVYPREAVAAGADDGGAWSPREALERVRARIEGEAVVSPWATVDTKAGVLAVHLNERSFESEIYADEVGYAGDRRFGDEAKLNIGKWVLRNLFLGFVREEQRARRARRDSTHSQDTTSSTPHRASVSSDASSRTSRPSLNDRRPAPPRASSSSKVVCAPKMVPVLPLAAAAAASLGPSPLLTPMIPLYAHPHPKDALVLPSIPQSPAVALNDVTPLAPRRLRTDGGKGDSANTDYFAVRTRQASTQGSATASALDDFSGWSGPGPGSQTTSPPTGLMGRLKSFGKLKRAVDVSTPSLPTTVEAPVVEVPAPEPAAKTPLQLLLAGPLTPPPSSEAPTLGLSPHIMLLIEEAAESGHTTVYRGTVGSTATDAHALEEAMPLWLVEYLSCTIKLSFVLLPWTGGKDGDEEQLPELLNTAQSKLTASRFLRVRKLILHVQEKLEKIDPHPSDTPRPCAEDLYEILCNDVVLPLDMSIAAVRQYVWRQSVELTMCYRRNHEMVAYRRTRGRM